MVREVDQERLDSGLGKIKKQLGRAVEKGRMEQSHADEVIGRIQRTLDYDDFADCDLVIEAITEDLDMKLEMWRELDQIVKQEALFATNTSSLAGDQPGGRDQAPGALHRPALLQSGAGDAAARGRPVDHDRARARSRRASSSAESLKKTVVHAQDKAGFIVNRLLIPYLLDAIRAYEEGFGSIEQIDAAMKGGANHPMGPFELLDFVGLDTTHSVGEIMFDEYRERRFAPPPTLRKLVDGRPPRAQVRARLLRLLG